MAFAVVHGAWVGVPPAAVAGVAAAASAAAGGSIEDHGRSLQPSAAQWQLAVMRHEQVSASQRRRSNLLQAGSAAALAALGLRAGRRGRRGAGPRRLHLACRRARGGDGAAAADAPGGLLVICGPSGVGKSTLVKQLLADSDWNQRLALVVSHTTRPPREGEVDGEHYHFVQRADMERMIESGAFLEYAEVHGNLYGTSVGAVTQARFGGRVCLLDVDVEGVRSIRRNLSDARARYCLITAEGGCEALEARLRWRNTDDEEGIARRMETARRELAEYTSMDWDCTILNEEGNPEAGARALLAVIWELGDLSVASGAGDDDGVPCAMVDEALEGCNVPDEAAGVPKKNVFMEFSALARKLGSEGVDLGQGFPNYDPPEFVIQALRDELDGYSGGEPRIRHQYTRTAGHVPLVEVLAKRYGGHFGRTLDPMKEIAVTVGATGGLFLALQAALSRAEKMAPAGAASRPREIVALEPFFELYRSQAQGLGATLRSVPLRFDEATRSFSLDAEALRAALGPQTAALIVNTPHNPTGKAFTEKELMAIADLARAHPHICVISDEVYKYMIFDPPDGAHLDTIDRPAGHFHMARLPGMWDQTLTVSSAGKTFGITGWQIGWVVGAAHWMEHIHRYMPNLQFCAPTLMQRALGRVFEIAKEPFDGAPSYYAWLRRDYARRRKLMVDAFESAGIKTVRSQGGFFILADIGELCGEDGPLGASWAAAVRPGEPRDWTFCRALAAQLGIVSLPISPFFGPDLPESVRTRFVRFCFAKTDATLEEAFRRLKTLRVSA